MFARAVDESVAVPSHWTLEMANILTIAERRGRIDAEGIAEFLSLIGQIDIVIDGTTHEPGLSTILDLARREGITSYDAAYLDLAQREGLQLATQDGDLAVAARRIGIDVIEG
jgi:predicted nucleic acid-binding protein